MGDANRPGRLALLAELLALNFHEHFELGPLMLYVDELPDQTTLNRSRLRSISRRVISRQLAVLGPADDVRKDEQCANERTDVDIWLTSDATEPADEPQTCEILPQGDNKSAYFVCSSMSAEQESAVFQPFTVSSLDCQDRLTILLADLNWANNTVRVLATSTPSAERRECGRCGAGSDDSGVRRVHVVAVRDAVLGQHASAQRQSLRNLSCARSSRAASHARRRHATRRHA